MYNVLHKSNEWGHNSRDALVRALSQLIKQPRKDGIAKTLGTAQKCLFIPTAYSLITASSSLQGQNSLAYMRQLGLLNEQTHSHSSHSGTQCDM